MDLVANHDYAVRSSAAVSSITALYKWLSGYLCQPNDNIGRSGPVCPFISPSMRAGSLEIRVRTVGLAPSSALISEIVRCALDEFGLITWTGANPALKCLIVMMPDLGQPYCGLLDDAHLQIKPEAVRRGLMIGQFHAWCQDTAVRNPTFMVSRSPVPVVAIRHMALHDILFLNNHKEWFNEYCRRFGDRYRDDANNIDPVFTELFRNACKEHGVAQ
jgi:uncharacterized protein DUF6875